MGSRLKRLFLGKSSSTSSNPNLKGSSYESAIALDPPVKGSYPVAGNGPNVLDELQRLRLQRETSGRQPTVDTNEPAPAPTIPRYREKIIERPRTAPHDGRAGGVYPSESNNDTHGRTRSGFSLKSHPSFNSSKRNSIRSIVETSPRPVPRQVSKSSTPKPREIKAYQPKKPAKLDHEADIPGDFTAPIALQQHRASQISRKSYIDLVDAYSNIRPYREVSRDRAKSSGMRNYGEDVADRNIAGPDLSSAELSYPESVDVSQGPDVVVAGEGGAHTRTAPARGPVLGQEQSSSDDILHAGLQTKANPTWSTQDTQPRPRPASLYPPRTDSTSAVAYSANRRRDDGWLAVSNPVHEDRVRTLSPFVSTSDYTDKEPEDSGQQVFLPPTLSPLIRARGQARTVTKEHNVPPLSFSRAAISFPIQHEPLVDALPLKSRRRTMSEVDQSAVTTGGTRWRSASLTTSAVPRDSQPDKQSARGERSYNTANRKSGMNFEGTKQLPSLEGVVDLSNTVDTDVTTRSLPAVTHEKVIPTRHEIREERVTREIHTHDVFHRILPVIETEVLPPKHYVPSSDGKGLIEIPEHMILGRTANGSPSRNWEIIQTRVGRGEHGPVLHPKTSPSHSSKPSQPLSQSNYQYTDGNIEEDDSADGPVIGFTRGDSAASTQSRGNPRVSPPTSEVSMTKNMIEPVLSRKKEYITKEGHPRTEYVWRHPPVFETATGKTQPIHIGGGLGDLSSTVPETAPVESYHSDEEDTEGAEFGAMGMPTNGEEDLLFRDTGYGHGTLPGLTDKAPLAGMSGDPRFVPEDFEIIRPGKVVGDEGTAKRKSSNNSEGEATKAVRMIREKRRSSGAASDASTVRASGNQDSIGGVERGVRGLNVRD